MLKIPASEIPIIGEQKAQSEPAGPPDPMLQFFSYDHLREPLKTVSQAFANLASAVATDLPRNPERTVALRKLLEAKDCAVRALLFR